MTFINEAAREFEMPLTQNDLAGMVGYGRCLNNDLNYRQCETADLLAMEWNEACAEPNDGGSVVHTAANVIRWLITEKGIKLP